MCCGSTVAFAQGVPPSSVPGELPPDAPATPAPPISPELERRLEELDQRTRIAERKLELAREGAAGQKPPAPFTSAAENGFGITSADKVFDVRIHALLQVDGRYAFSDAAAFQDKVNTFLLRRVRPSVDATVLGLVDLRITPDFGNGTTAIYDAYADIHPTTWLRFRAGKFKPPIGLERLQTDAWVPFPERTLDSNLSSQRDVGLEIWGDIADAAAHYELAVLNGAPDGSIVDVDNERKKSVAGRLFLRPFQLGELRALGDLGFGFAVESGDEKGSTAVANGAASNAWLPTFKSVGQQTIFTYPSSGTDPTLTVFANGHHTRINPQLYYYVGPFGLLAEWVRESQQLGKGTQASAGAVNNTAGHVTASYVIGGLETYDGPRVAKPLNWATKDLGALELAGRYGWLDVDDVAFANGGYLADPTKSVSAANNWGVSANWWFSRNVKIAVTFEQTRFTGGAGTSKAVADRATENVGFGRVQVGF